jgi:hypothetical protein
VTAQIIVPRDHLEVAERPETRHWETDRPEQSPRGPEPHELTDAATREYVFKRTQRDEPTHASDSPDELIDLTTPGMVEPDPLPMRRPGRAFGEPPAGPSTGPGEGATGIRSALSAYERGRRAAHESSPLEEDT